MQVYCRSYACLDCVSDGPHWLLMKMLHEIAAGPVGFDLYMAPPVQPADSAATDIFGCQAWCMKHDGSSDDCSTSKRTAMPRRTGLDMPLVHRILPLSAALLVKLQL